MSVDDEVFITDERMAETQEREAPNLEKQVKSAFTLRIIDATGKERREESCYITPTICNIVVTPHKQFAALFLIYFENLRHKRNRRCHNSFEDNCSVHSASVMNC